MTTEKIIIGVATYGRSDYLKDCLNSLANLALPDSRSVELMLVDNNPKPQAESTLNSIQFSIQVHYFHEKNRGIVHARNRILLESLSLNADYLGFLDDDEMAEENWLTQAVQSLSGHISIVTGPCEFQFDQPTNWLPHSRIFSPKNHDTAEYAGTSSTRNVFFDMKIVKKHTLRFEEKLNWLGGSDTFFFIQARALGYRTYWDNRMLVSEQIPKSRANLKWVLKRNLRLGGGRIHRERLLKPKILVISQQFFVALGIVLIGLAETLFLFWQGHHLIRGIEKITHGVGMFYALLGFDYQEYKSHHGH